MHPVVQNLRVNSGIRAYKSKSVAMLGAIMPDPWPPPDGNGAPADLNRVLASFGTVSVVMMARRRRPSIGAQPFDRAAYSSEPVPEAPEDR
jgi:hypothetical protein